MKQSDILVRTCVPEDIEQVIAINRQWQKAARNGDVSSGFVTGEVQHDYLTEVIERKEIVVALHQDLVIGYYMVNDIAHAPTNYAKIQQMINEGYLDTSIKTGLAAQTAIQSDYHGLGLRKALLDQLILNISSQYDLIITSINKSNLRSCKTSVRGGWRIFDEDEEQLYAFYQLHNRSEQDPLYVTKLLKKLTKR